MILRRGLIAAAVAASAAMPALAAPVIFSGVLDLRAGYGSNPFFSQNSRGGSPQVGGTLSGTLTKLTGRSKTTLLGSVDIDQNLKYYGRTNNYLTTLTRLQQITSRLTGNADISYSDSINPRDTPGEQVATVDLLTIGQHTRRLFGDAGLVWQATDRDLLRAGVNVSHSIYSGLGASDNTQYGASLGYLRTINSRTQVGIQASAVAVNSQRYPDSHSYQLGGQLVQKLSAYWVFNGSVGAIFQGGTLGGGTSTTLGFNGSLCGTYPRYNICVTASRQSAPSGIGGLRTDLQGGVNVSYTLSARSRVNFGAVFDSSSSKSTTLPRQRYYSANAGYSRDITPRLAVGGTGRYQRRNFGGLLGTGSGSVNAYTVSADVIYKFGRIS